MVLVVKNPPANAGDVRNAGLIPGSGRSPGGGHGNPPQYSRLENPMDRGAWQAMVHRVTKWWTQLKQLSTHTCMVILCFIIWGTARLFSKAVVAFYILTSCVWAFNISIQLLYFLFSNFLILAILVFAEWYLTVVLICIHWWLMMFNSFFLYLLVIWISSLKTHLFRFFAHFFIGWSFYHSVVNVHYIFQVQIYQLHDLQIFSCVLRCFVCLFYFLVKVSKRGTLGGVEILMKTNLFFLLLLILLLSQLRIFCQIWRHEVFCLCFYLRVL